MTYKKESLELLRQRIDLADVVGAHLPLQRSGSSHKACCPFHEEKTPSFIIQKGDSHYHCYGCGAHGDAIAFLMGFLKMSFVEAIEYLADRFQVALDKEEHEEKKGPSKSALRTIMEQASRFYHFALLHSEEGHEALKYLYKRGIDLTFIRNFQIGFAPKQADFLQKAFKSVSKELLIASGLITLTKEGYSRDFFSDRIVFPICDALGHIIGFSARKFKESTSGGKYINTPETFLFKKSNVLFGLNHSRARISKERRAIIVEGQIDALRLIHAGFNYTVAGQGTAFGEGHVAQLLSLGVNLVFLALDGDEAGQEAAVKIGDLFQKKGVEVAVVSLPKGCDPDLVLREKGPAAFSKYLEEAQDFLTFLVQRLSKKLDLSSPSQKNELIQIISEKIQRWEKPVMVHESLRKLANLTQVPEDMVIHSSQPSLYIAKSGKLAPSEIDPNLILEMDLLRWMILGGEAMPRIIEIIRLNLSSDHFHHPFCHKFFSAYMRAYQEKRSRDLLSLGQEIESEDQHFLSEMLQKKINLQRAEEGVMEGVKKILIRNWMEKRETIRLKIHSGNCSEEEVMQHVKEFDLVKKHPPEIVLP